jgi:two-component system, OmpR family, response regulator MtrA
MTSELLIPLSVLVLNATEERRAAVAATLPAGEVELVSLADLGSGTELPREFIDLCIIDGQADATSTVSLVQRARRRWPTVGICCLGCSDVVAALEAGADDVVPAGADPAVEAAQLAAAYRRARVVSTQLRVAFGDVVYDREARRVWVAGKEVMLTPRELRLFDILFISAGAPVPVGTLQDYVWKEEFPRESNALAVYVSYLRRKLSASRLATLESIRGVGYRLARRE